MTTPFNPIINTAAATECKRFAPREERSIFCRSCNQAFYAHTPKARRFDSVMVMHRAYMSDDEIIKWLISVGKNLDEQLEMVDQILDLGQEVVGAPDLKALAAVQACLKQMIIERDLNAAPKTAPKKPDLGYDFRRCAFCKQVLAEEEERTCLKCSEMVCDGAGAADPKGAGEVQEPFTPAPHAPEVDGRPYTADTFVD